MMMRSQIERLILNKEGNDEVEEHHEKGEESQEEGGDSQLTDERKMTVLFCFCCLVRLCCRIRTAARETE